MYINPKYPGRRTPRCPHPNCPSNQEPWTDPWEAAQCTLNKPIWMVIPPEGVHISCPVHPEGHHIYGSPITSWEIPMWKENNLPDPANTPWCESKGLTYEHDPSKDLTYDSTKPYGTATGFTGKDTFKFSM
jgi:hypothetical protein